MTPHRDEIERLLSLLETAVDGVSSMSDEEVQEALAKEEQWSGPSAGEIIGRGWNRNITDADPTAHAEIVALRQAAAHLGNHRLGDCELFVTIEPCPMCAGALVHSRVKRVVYGADDPKAGAIRSVLQVLNHPKLNHRTEVRAGVLAGRSAELLQSFFKSRREESR